MKLKKFLSLLILLMVGAAAGFIIGMRYKIPAVVNRVRRLNKAYMNPKQLENAGAPGAYAAVLHHVGRRSGKPYATPIGVTPFEDGFVVNLPYGSDTDWLRNLVAAGKATLEYEGETITVDRPQVVSVDAIEDAFTAADRRVHRLFAIDECLVMHRTE